MALPSAPSLEPPFPENDPEAWSEELDNPSKREFSPLLDKDVGEPIKSCLQPKQLGRAQQGKGIHFPVPSQPHEVCLVFLVQFQQNQHVYL